MGELAAGEKSARVVARNLFSIALLGSMLASACEPALAGPITVTGPFNIDDNRSANEINFGTGEKYAFGATSVVPNGGAGTTGSAQQGAVTLPVTWVPFTASPNLFNETINANPALRGAWTLTFTNGADQTISTTPILTGVTAEPFVNNATYSGSGLTPTIRWTNPPGTDGTTVIIRDFSRPVGNTIDVIHVAALAPTTTQYTLPSVLSTGLSLVLGQRYSIEIDAVVTRNGTGSLALSNTFKESRAFFEFTPQAGPLPPQVFLPIVSPGPVYQFDMPVVAGQTYYVDPLVASGYTYVDGATDPAIASITLPSGIGDNLFDLWTFDGINYIDSGLDLVGGTSFDFLTNGFLDGIRQFQIRGIETSAGLDPNNPMAFITGLTFVGGGQFTGTMTPITTFVPEPATLALVGVGLAGLGFSGRRKLNNRRAMNATTPPEWRAFRLRALPA